MSVRDETWQSIAEAVGPRTDGEDARQDRAARVWWSCVIEPGDRIGGALIRARGAVEAAEIVRREPAPAELAQLIDVSPAEARAALARWSPRIVHGAGTDAVDRARRHRVVVIVPGDAAWPVQLHDLGDHAPPCLWVRGDVGRLRAAAPAVALVGARAATSYGEHVAGELAAGLAQSGTTVVSGAAYGIDGAAHRAALSSGGTTFAYLAGGCDRSYPTGHSDLLDRIAVGGAVLSEVPCGAAPTKWRFLQRNRLIAAATDATVVVEAGLRSGSLNTAGHAAALGRPLGAVPGPVTSAASAGTHRLLREFDAVCITGAPDIRELLGGEAESDPRAPTAGDADRTRVLDALSERTAWPTSAVAARTGMALGEVEAVLGTLLLEGRVEPAGDGWRRRRG
jgi:DNA processing protein